MISFLLSVLLFAALGISVYLKSGVLFLFATSLAIMWMLCMLSDILQIKRELQGAHFTDVEGVFVKHSEYFTSPMNSVMQLLAEKRSEVIKNLEKTKIQTFDAKSTDDVYASFRKNIATLLEESEPEDVFLKKIARLMQEVGRSENTTVSFRRDVDVYIHTTPFNEIPAFKNLLDDLARRIFENNEQELLGLQTQGAAGVIGEQFESFGFKHFIVVKVEAKGKQYLLWSGYKKKMLPQHNQLQALQAFCEALERELVASHSQRELATKVDEAQGLNNAKTDFIAHLSHDIRSPLHNVKSVLQLLKSEVEGEVPQDLVRAGIENCENAEEVVEELLDFSKYSSGDLKADKLVFNLAACVRQIVAANRYVAKVKGLELEVLGPDTLVTEADKKQVKRIVQNLISNAIKYTENGHVQVVLSPLPANRLGLKVMDTGRGMSQKQVEQLFSPFARFHKDMADGVGLGLVLTKILVELNGGSIRVASHERQGTTFSIVLPASQKEVPFHERMLEESISDYTRLETESEDILPLKPKDVKQRILLLDDDVDYVKTLCRSLEYAGYQVFQAYSVEQAISIFNFEQPDIVLSDLEVPNGGGERLFDFVSTSASPKPVIILSGKEDKSLRVELLAKGVREMLVKPADMDILVACIEKNVLLKEAV